MRIKRICAVAALTATASAGTVLPAQAATPAAVPATAAVISVSPVSLVPGSRDIALVSGTFICTGKVSHLWIGVKQGPGDLTQPGSSNIAKSYYQKSYNNVITCDGTLHTQTFTVEREKGNLHEGKVYLQFCLYAGTAFDSDMRYRRAQLLL